MQPLLLEDLDAALLELEHIFTLRHFLRRLVHGALRTGSVDTDYGATGESLSTSYLRPINTVGWGGAVV